MAPPLARFLSPYHLTHLVVLLAYPLLGSGWLKVAFPRNNESLWQWEKQIAATCVAVLLMKFLKKDNLDQFLASAIMYLEASLLALLYVATRPDFGVFGVGVLVSFLGCAFLIPPRYSGATKAVPMTPAGLHSQILRPEWTKSDAAIQWVVLVHADWSSNSTALEPTFHDISMKYTTDNVKFVTIDVGRWPETAEATLGVPLDATGPACAVPSILLFKKGEELVRVPRAYLEGTKIKGSRLRAVDIVKGLGLEEAFEKAGGGERLEAQKKE